MSGELPYLVYYPTENRFLGVPPSVTLFTGDSEFINKLLFDFDSGNPFAMGFLLTPDEDFFTLTLGFKTDGATGFTNGLGELLALTEVPEPADLFLLCLGLVALLVTRSSMRLPGRSDHGAGNLWSKG